MKTGWCTGHDSRWRSGVRGDEFTKPIRSCERQSGPCRVAGCERKAVTRGVCHAHYTRGLAGKKGAELEKAIEVRLPRPEHCERDGCVRPVHRNSRLCSMHRARKERGTNADAPKRKSPSQCQHVSKDGQKCNRGGRITKGLCSRHYQRLLRGTDPDVKVRWNGKPRPLYAERYKDGYVEINLLNGRWAKKHRFIMSQALGRELHPFEIVHHKNGTRDDNRLENLELMVVNQHATGQRVQDSITWAKEVIDLYGDQFGLQVIETSRAMH